LRGGRLIRLVGRHVLVGDLLLDPGPESAFALVGALLREVSEDDLALAVLVVVTAEAALAEEGSRHVGVPLLERLGLVRPSGPRRPESRAGERGDEGHAERAAHGWDDRLAVTVSQVPGRRLALLRGSLTSDILSLSS